MGYLDPRGSASTPTRRLCEDTKIVDVRDKCGRATRFGTWFWGLARF